MTHNNLLIAISLGLFSTFPAIGNESTQYSTMRTLYRIAVTGVVGGIAGVTILALTSKKDLSKDDLSMVALSYGIGGICLVGVTEIYVAYEKKDEKKSLKKPLNFTIKN